MAALTTGDNMTADTSVVVPALADWHPLHEQALAAVRDVRQLPAHVLVETVSVLTRLRGGVASPVTAVVKALRDDFPGEPYVLGPAGTFRLLDSLAAAAVSGGRVYDALVGATAAAANARLITADRRALPTYAAVGAEVHLLS
jgi:predicted nucleic acid-binding protein